MKHLGMAAALVFLAACGGNGDHAHPESNGSMHGHQQEHVHQDMNRLEEVDRRDAPAPHALSGVLADEFDAMLDSYLRLTDALVEASAAQAAESAGQLAGKAGRFNTVELDQAVRGEASGWIETVRQRSREIAGETDVEAQRRSYHELSETLIVMVEMFGHQRGALYHQRCPMVNGGNGDWLSVQEGILNPYHGSRMLRCGMTVRIL